MIPVCVFAKPPIPRKVKTRLAQVIGDEAAAKLASAMFCDVWRAVRSCPGVRPVLATSESGAFPVSIPPDDIWLQGDGDLGTRLEYILTRALNIAPAAVAIGADSPLFSPSHLRDALQALHAQQAVVGPSHDGGFYLLGLPRCPPGLLSGLPWSNHQTCLATVHRLEQFEFSVQYTAQLFDVDTPADLALLASSLFDLPAIAPATRAWLFEHNIFKTLNAN